MNQSSKQVVVALDGSENSHRALLAALSMAEAMGRELGLLHVDAMDTERRGRGLFGLKKLAGDKLTEARSRRVKEIFEGAEALMGSHRLPVHRHLLVGDPAEEIVSFMQTHPDVLLVLGRRGQSTLSRLLMGSVSDKVTRHAPGLVTVVS